MWPSGSVERLNILDKIIIGIGVLDVSYIAWIVVNSISGEPSHLWTLWNSITSYGLPFPALQFGAIIAVYASVLVCGLALIFRNRKLVWLNYVQFPLRLMLVIPSLYPVFYLLGKLGVQLGVGITIAILCIIEMGRVAFVFKWRQHAT
jgi:hypothetical protein